MSGKPDSDMASIINVAQIIDEDCTEILASVQHVADEAATVLRLIPSRRGRRQMTVAMERLLGAAKKLQRLHRLHAGLVGDLSHRYSELADVHETSERLVSEQQKLITDLRQAMNDQQEIIRSYRERDQQGLH
jgi:hypothetical protein